MPGGREGDVLTFAFVRSFVRVGRSSFKLLVAATYERTKPSAGGRQTILPTLPSPLFPICPGVNSACG